MGSTGQSTNAWSQQLGIIGIFDDDRSIWVWRSHEVPSCYHFIILPRETLTHQTHTLGHTTQDKHTREKRSRGHPLAPEPTPEGQRGLHPSPIEPQISPDSANARLFWEKMPTHQVGRVLMQGESCLKKTIGSKTRVEARRGPGREARGKRQGSQKKEPC